MMARTKMRHRATVRRNISGETDAYGARTRTIGESGLTPLPCYFQPRMARTSTSDGKLIAVSDAMIFAPADSDLQEEDIVIRVTDRRGAVLSDTNHRVTAVVRRETHIEAVAEQYGG